MENYVVPKINLSATDGRYNKGLPIEAPLPATVAVEVENHPELFDIVGNVLGVPAPEVNTEKVDTEEVVAFDVEEPKITIPKKTTSKKK
jgi:hypothetical protein